MMERSTRGMALAGSLLLAGCLGYLDADDPAGDGGPQTWPAHDGGAPSDAAIVASDAGERDGGGDRDAGVPEPDAGPPDPCAGVSCGENASCAEGDCRCNPGFVEMSGACVALPPGDPAGRTQAEVCDAWRMGRVENASPAWTAGASECASGTMAPAAIDDVLRRVNMYRWLAGLGPVGHDASRHRELMDCAHMMSVNRSLSHDPPSSWTCYTAGGANAAGRSNIALGYRSPGAAIDGYMADTGTPSLGHRRWILNGPLGAVEIGFSASDRPGQCLGVFDRSGTTDRPWTAYPNQGFAPLATAAHTWSFHANSISLGGASVDVVRVSDGAALAVDAYEAGLSGPPPSIGFTPRGWTPTAGETYRVTIRGTSAGDITYDVIPVDC